MEIVLSSMRIPDSLHQGLEEMPAFLHIILDSCNKICHLHRSEKEKTKFQQEVFELMSQIESINKEKVCSYLIIKDFSTYKVQYFCTVDQLETM